MKTRLALLFAGLFLTACGNSSTPSNSGSNAAPTPAAPTPAAPTNLNERAALDVIGKINEAQVTYFKLNRRFALTFEELIDAKLLAADPTTTQSGYEFKLRPAADAQTYTLAAVPAVASTDARYFFTDQSGIIRAETGKDASADSPKA